VNAGAVVPTVMSYQSPSTARISSSGCASKSCNRGRSVSSLHVAGAGAGASDPHASSRIRRASRSQPACAALSSTTCPSACSRSAPIVLLVNWLDSACSTCTDHPHSLPSTIAATCSRDAGAHASGFNVIGDEPPSFSSTRSVDAVRTVGAGVVASQAWTNHIAVVISTPIQGNRRIASRWEMPPSGV
jgi:hypothetical protein